MAGFGLWIGLMLLLSTACGGPTDTGGTAAPPAPAQASSTAEEPAEDAGAQPGTVSEVIAALDGLNAEERRERLLELVEAEGSQLMMYTSNPWAPDVAGVFGEEFGIELEFYDGGAEDVSVRIYEEHQAGRTQADLIEALNPVDRSVMVDEGILAEYSSPLLDGYPEEAIIDDYFVASRWTVSNVAWNTDLIPEEAWPESLEDLIDIDGQVMIESRQAGWLMAVYDYYMDELGWTEDRVKQMLFELADGALITTGHSFTAELLASGEAAAAANTYHSHIEARQAEGAPVTWTPPVKPVTVRPNGAVLLEDAPHPAAAVLYQDWMIENVDIWADHYSQVPVTALSEPPFSDIADAVIVEDQVRAVEEADKWEALLDEIIGRGTRVEGEG